MSVPVVPVRPSLGTRGLGIHFACAAKQSMGGHTMSDESVMSSRLRDHTEFTEAEDRDDTHHPVKDLSDTIHDDDTRHMTHVWKELECRVCWRSQLTRKEVRRIALKAPSARRKIGTTLRGILGSGRPVLQERDGLGLVKLRVEELLHRYLSQALAREGWLPARRGANPTPTHLDLHRAALANFPKTSQTSWGGTVGTFCRYAAEYPPICLSAPSPPCPRRRPRPCWPGSRGTCARRLRSPRSRVGGGGAVPAERLTP